jgi:hypothetical protein
MILFTSFFIETVAAGTVSAFVKLLILPLTV